MFVQGFSGKIGAIQGVIKNALQREGAHGVEVYLEDEKDEAHGESGQQREDHLPLHIRVDPGLDTPADLLDSSGSERVVGTCCLRWDIPSQLSREFCG